MLTIIKNPQAQPHVVADGEGKRTHYLGEVRMKIAANRPAQAPVKRTSEEVKSDV